MGELFHAKGAKGRFSRRRKGGAGNGEFHAPFDFAQGQELRLGEGRKGGDSRGGAMARQGTGISCRYAKEPRGRDIQRVQFPNSLIRST